MSLLLLFLLLAQQPAYSNPYQNRIELLEEQIELLKFQQEQIIRSRDADRVLRGSMLRDIELPPQWFTLERQILNLQADIEAERLREQQAIRQRERDQQREQTQNQRSQERKQKEEVDQLVNQRMVENLENLLILQQEELTRLEGEYRQTLPAYQAGLITENQWNTLQRRINVQQERIQRTENRIEETIVRRE